MLTYICIYYLFRKGEKSFYSILRDPMNKNKKGFAKYRLRAGLENVLLLLV